MLMRCERRGQLEARGNDFVYFCDIRPQANQGSQRAERLVAEQLQECDGCGVIAPDVDLWAENSETGEQIWLCLTCGGW